MKVRYILGVAAALAAIVFFLKYSTAHSRSPSNNFQTTGKVPSEMPQRPISDSRGPQHSGQKRSIDSNAFAVTVPTPDEVRQVQTNLILLAERSGGQLTLTPDELSVLTTEFSRLLAVNNALKADRARKLTLPDGTIVIEVPADPGSASDIASMAYNTVSKQLGRARANEIYSVMGDGLFDYFRGYGLGEETVTLRPSQKQPGVYDVSYDLNITSSVQGPAAHVFNSTARKSGYQSVGLTAEQALHGIEYGYLLPVLAGGG